jgi:hypothetical protein
VRRQLFASTVCSCLVIPAAATLRVACVDVFNQANESLSARALKDGVLPSVYNCALASFDKLFEPVKLSANLSWFFHSSHLSKKIKHLPEQSKQ